MKKMALSIIVGSLLMTSLVALRMEQVVGQPLDRLDEPNAWRARMKPKLNQRKISRRSNSSKNKNSGYATSTDNPYRALEETYYWFYPI